MSAFPNKTTYVHLQCWNNSMKDHSTITLLVPALRLLNVTTNALRIVKETTSFISI